MSTKSKFVATVWLFAAALAVIAGLFFFLAADHQMQDAELAYPSSAGALNNTPRQMVDAATDITSDPAAGNRSLVRSSRLANGLRDTYRIHLSSSSNKSKEGAEEASNYEDTGAAKSSSQGSRARAVPPSNESPSTGDPGPSSEATKIVPAPREAGNSLADNAAKGANTPQVRLPAALLEPDESIVISTELQVAAWEELQNNFIEAVGGKIPSDEDARANWIRAQQDSDDLFRLKFGWDAFNAQQQKAYREGLAPEQR